MGRPPPGPYPLDIPTNWKVYGSEWEVCGAMKTKRQVELFTAGCPVCEPAVQLVRELACPDCEITVHDLREGGGEKVREYGINTVPAVVVDGHLVSRVNFSGRFLP